MSQSLKGRYGVVGKVEPQGRRERSFVDAVIAAICAAVLVGCSSSGSSGNGSPGTGGGRPGSGGAGAGNASSGGSPGPGSGGQPSSSGGAPAAGTGGGPVATSGGAPGSGVGGIDAGSGGTSGPGAAGGGAIGPTGGVGGPIVGSGGAGASGAAGGAPAVSPPEANRVRTIIPFDGGWLFNVGDATGADQVAFADTSWRALSVPHDWSIEGPFSMSAATTGRGGYLPSGIGWYRKHFTLPQSLSGRRVFIEFDGVMANSDVYINGVHLGNRPYGYVGFRYDITASAKFGATENVIAVKCDNSLQPASRYYAGAGIYRHVRLIGTDPVHVDQWATFVTSPAATAASATVHVATTVVNAGASAASVSLQAIVTDPTGKALAPVSVPAQSVAPGAAGTAFTLDIPITSPKLWDLASPSMYSLTLAVQVGGSTVDDDVTPFGVRSLTFDAAAGMTLNGKSVKLKGVAIHQEMSGLGVAVPQRAWQRRLAQFKTIGVNAIRTSHNPFAPEFLDLADRMGILILDEFFDVWTQHKYTDAGDYATYFSKPAPAVTGSPVVPAAIAGGGATWWQTDITDVVMHDRNHPSVILYSAGNEIRDPIGTRSPLLTKMVDLCHALDPSRSVTQALFDPGTNGDVTGATRTILDVWGNNYNIPNCLTAMSTAPARAGVLTEMGHETSAWGTVMSTASLAGEFVWSGMDYLGEAPNAWPVVGSGSSPLLGLLDRLGNPNPDGYTWQKVWGAPATAAPATGTTATQVALAADHGTLLADSNDVVYVKATIADASGKVVPTSAAPVTFSIQGPGTIVAVDSATQMGESFRGNVRNAFNGVCYAIVQATGPGAITVSAAAAGLSGGTATVQAAAGTFTPCSGTCD
jgi:beta-galactosidase